MCSLVPNESSIGGICTGIVAATESAFLAVVYAMAYSLIVREISFKRLLKIMYESVQAVGSCMIILCTCSLFGYILTAEKIPQKGITILLGITDNYVILILIITAFLLIVGTFMDATPAIGLITPPAGSWLYLASGLSKLSIKKISKAVLPLILVNTAVLLLAAYVPFLTTWIPLLIYDQCRIRRIFAAAAAKQTPSGDRSRYLLAVAAAARSGAEATAGMVARYGRAKNLQTDSLGHRDPGVVSPAMMIRAVCLEAVKELEHG